MNLRHAHFIVLVLILVSGVLTFWGVAPDKSMQMWVGLATTLSYILWGVIYHALEGDMHAKVVVEYVLVGAIAMVILATVLWT
jgi:hypothetical protein